MNYVILPLAKSIMDPQQAAQASAEGYMASTVMHEICHGLGPAYSRTSAGRKDIREALADVFPGLEEAKADVVGMYSLKFLMDKGVLPKEREQEYYRERNLTHPKRCKPCRDARRANFGGSRGAGGERQRFEITCDQCGKTDCCLNV